MDIISKDFWKSRMFWLGVLEIAGSIAAYFSTLPQGVSITGMITGVVTIVLRFLTTAPLNGTAAAEKAQAAAAISGNKRG